MRPNSSKRVERILDATRAILREGGNVGFTIKEVAVRAKVAPATVFNLVGTKDGLFYALLSRLLDELFIGVRRYRSPYPLEHAIEATNLVVDLFLSDPKVFRELFLVFLGTRDELHRPWFMHRSLSFWRHSIASAVQANLLPAYESDDDALPRALMLAFIGSVDLWVHGDLDDAGFRAQSLYGAALTVLGATNTQDTRMLARLREIKRQLPAHHTFLRYLVPELQKGTRSERTAVRLSESEGGETEPSAGVDKKQTRRPKAPKQSR